MSFGANSFGAGSFGANASTSSGATTHSATASLSSGSATLSGSASRSAGAVTHAATAALVSGSAAVSASSAHGTYDYRIAVIGDSNASGRGTNSQTYTNGSSIQTDLYNNAGSVVTLADPWDGGTNTYAALDDGASAIGSYIPRLAQRFINASKKTLWIPANKGGTASVDWAYSTSTATAYGAMKARIDAAGGVDIIIIHLGANDAIASVSQATFKTRIEAIVGHLLTDYPSAKVYLPKIHHFTGYTSQVDAIRAGVDDVLAGTSGALPGADLEGITTNVHYTSDADLDAVGARMYSSLFPHVATGAISADVSSISASSTRTGAAVTHTSTASLSSSSASVSASAAIDGLSIARPVSDTSNSGWSASSGSDLFAMIDEVTPSDSDYVTTSSAGSVFVFKLSNTTSHGSVQKLQCRAWSTSGNGVTIQLYQGNPGSSGTVIATWSPTLTSSPALYERSLTSGEISSISDYSNLYIKQTST